MPIYTVDGVKYDIPDNEVQSFLETVKQQGKTAVLETTDKPATSEILGKTQATTMGAVVAEKTEPELALATPEAMPAIGDSTLEDTLSVSENDKRLAKYYKGRFRQGKFFKDERNAYEKFIQTGIVDTSLLPEEAEAPPEWDPNNAVLSLFKKVGLIVPKIVVGVKGAENMLKKAMVSSVGTIMGQSEEEKKAMYDFYKRLPTLVSPMTATAPMAIGSKPGTPREDIKEIEAELYRPEDPSISKNFLEGNIGDAAYNLASGIIDSAASVAAAFGGPASIITYAISIAGEKFEEEEEADPSASTTALIANAVATGAIQGLADLAFGKILRSAGLLKGKVTAEDLTDFIRGGYTAFQKKFLKPSVQEFGVEMAQDYATKLVDDLTLNKEIDYKMSMYQIVDVALLTGIMTSGTVAIASPGTKAQRQYAESMLMDNDSKNKLNELAEKINASVNEIQNLEEDSPLRSIAENIYFNHVKNYQEIKENWLRGLYAMDNADLKEYAKLKDISLAAQDKISEENTDIANENLKETIKVHEDKAKKVVDQGVRKKIRNSLTSYKKEGAVGGQLDIDFKILEGKKLQEFADNVEKEALAKLEKNKDNLSLDEYIEAAQEIQQTKQNILDSNGFVDSSGKNNIVYVNLDSAVKNRATTIADHEVLHKVMQKTIDNQQDNMIILGNAVSKAFQTATKNDAFKLISFNKKLHVYNQRLTGPQKEQKIGVEKFNFISDLLNSKAISLDETGAQKIKGGLRRFFQNYGLQVKFNTDQDLLNFIIDYNKAMQKDGVLSKQLLKAAKEGITGKLTVEQQQDQTTVGSIVDFSLDTAQDQDFEMEVETRPLSGDESLATQKTNITSKFSVESPTRGKLDYTIKASSVAAYFQGTLQGKRLNIVFDSDEFKQEVVGDTGVGMQVLGNVFNRVKKMVDQDPEITEVVFEGEGKRGRVYDLLAKAVSKKFNKSYSKKDHLDRNGKVYSSSFIISMQDNTVSEKDINKIENDENYINGLLFSLEQADDNSYGFEAEQVTQDQVETKEKKYENNFLIYSSNLDKKLDYKTKITSYDVSEDYEEDGIRYEEANKDKVVKINDMSIDITEDATDNDITNDPEVISKIMGTVISQVNNFINDPQIGLEDYKSRRIYFLSDPDQKVKIDLYKKVANALSAKYNGQFKISTKNPRKTYISVDFSQNQDNSYRSLNDIGPETINNVDLLFSIDEELESLGGFGTTGGMSRVERLEQELLELEDDQYYMDPDEYEQKLQSLERQIKNAKSGKTKKPATKIEVLDLNSYEGIKAAEKIAFEKLESREIDEDEYNEKMAQYAVAMEVYGESSITDNALADSKKRNKDQDLALEKLGLAEEIEKEEKLEKEVEEKDKVEEKPKTLEELAAEQIQKHKNRIDFLMSDDRIYGEKYSLDQQTIDEREITNLYTKIDRLEKDPTSINKANVSYKPPQKVLTREEQQAFRGILPKKEKPEISEEQREDNRRILREKQKRIPFFTKLAKTIDKDNLKGLFKLVKWGYDINKAGSKASKKAQYMKAFNEAFELSSLFKDKSQKKEALAAIENAIFNNGFTIENFFAEDFFNDPNKKVTKTINQINEEIKLSDEDFSAKTNFLFFDKINRNRKPGDPVPDDQQAELFKIYKNYIFRNSYSYFKAQEQRVGIIPLSQEQIKSNIELLIANLARTFDPKKQYDLINPVTNEYISGKKVKKILKEEGLSLEEYKTKYGLTKAIPDANAFINKTVKRSINRIYEGQSKESALQVTVTEEGAEVDTGQYGTDYSAETLLDDYTLQDFTSPSGDQVKMPVLKSLSDLMSLNRVVQRKDVLQGQVLLPLEEHIKNILDRSILKVSKDFDTKLEKNQTIPLWITNLKAELKNELEAVMVDYIKTYKPLNEDNYNEEGFLIENQTNILGSLPLNDLAKTELFKRILQKSIGGTRIKGKGLRPNFISPLVQPKKGVKDFKRFKVEYQKFTQDGKTKDFDRATATVTGRTSGDYIQRRNPNWKTIITQQEFLEYFLQTNEFGERVIENAKRKSLARNIGSVLGMEILKKDIDNQGPLYQKFLASRPEIKEDLIENEYAAPLRVQLTDRLYDRDPQIYYDLNTSDVEADFSFDMEGDKTYSKKSTVPTLESILSMSGQKQKLSDGWPYITRQLRWDKASEAEILASFKGVLQSLAGVSESTANDVISEIKDLIKDDKWDMDNFIKNGPQSDAIRAAIAFEEQTRAEAEKKEIIRKSKLTEKQRKREEEAEAKLQEQKAAEEGLTLEELKEKGKKNELARRIALIIEKKAAQKNKGVIPEYMSVEETLKGIEIEAKQKAYRPKLYEKFVLPPDAEGLPGLLDRLILPGKEGEIQRKYLEDQFIDKYFKVINEWEAEKLLAIKKLKTISKRLQSKVNLGAINEATGYTNEQLIQVAMFTHTDLNAEIPGLDLKTDEGKELVRKMRSEVLSNADLNEFYISLKELIGEGNSYPKPTKNWHKKTILIDFLAYSNEDLRKSKLAEWKKEKNASFNKDNMLKLEKMFGENYVQSLKDVFRRMETGRNVRGSKESNSFLNWDNWVNAAVAKIMFLNRRSGALQLLSAGNYITSEDNDIDNALKAIYNIKQFKEDVIYIMNSPFAETRRSGVKVDVAAADLARETETFFEKAGSVGQILKRVGYFFTTYGDSAAIAFGGATFYRNRVNTYLSKMPKTESLYTIDKNGRYKGANGKFLSKNQIAEVLAKEKELEQKRIKKAEEKAWFDFTKFTRLNQQSSDPALVSKQQASNTGKLILAFKNTPMQYAAIYKKATLDLYYGRGNKTANMRKVLYYALMQNAVFTALQQAVWTDDSPEDEKWYKTVINGVVDSILGGLGMAGNAAAVTKNAVLGLLKEDTKADIAKDVLKLAPALNDKFRNFENLSRVLNKKDTAYKIKDIFLFSGENARKDFIYFAENPLFEAGSDLLAGVLNAPTDRVYDLVSDLNTFYKRTAEYYHQALIIDQVRRQDNYVNAAEYRFSVNDPDPDEMKAFKYYKKTGVFKKDLLPEYRDPKKINPRNYEQADLDGMDWYKSMLLLMGWPAWQLEAESEDYIGPDIKRKSVTKKVTKPVNK